MAEPSQSQVATEQEAETAPPPVPLFPATKFLPPPARPEHVHRDRCLAYAVGPLAPPHLLLSAGAGMGKSTLAAQWAASVGPTAWISLAPPDSEPGSMWAAVIVALQMVSPSLGDGAVGALLGGTPPRSVLVSLIDDIAVHGDDVALVFDDLHLVSSAESHADLEWLMINAPPNLHIGICTREDPPLAIHRLVARGLLTDFYAREISFDAGEITEFMRDRLKLDIDEATAREIGERFDGWAAGIYLAALSLRAGHSADDLFRDLDAGHRRVNDYMQSEALSSLDPTTLALLEVLGLLPRFCAGLVDALLGHTDSAQRLAELNASNMFVILLDAKGEWLRLHHLFGNLLAERITAREPERVLEIHRRAGAWHRQHGNTAEAIDHLIAGEAFEDAAAVIAAAVPLQINVSRLAGTLSGWLDALPPTMVSARPALSLARAWVGAITNDKAECDRWLAVALAGEPSPAAQAEAHLLQATFCFKDYAAGGHHAEEATRLEPDDSPWKPLTQLMRGWYLWHSLKPENYDGAIEAYRRSEALAISMPAHVASIVLAPVLGGLVHLDRGDLRAAGAAGRRSGEARKALGVERVPQMLNSYFGTARIHRLLGRLDEAARDAEAAAVLVADYPSESDSLLIAVPVTVELAMIRMEQGDFAAARAALDEAARRLEGAIDSGRIGAMLDDAEQRYAEGGGQRPAEAAEPGELSKRELTILRMLSGTGSSKEIAGELFVSQNTLKTHRRAIYKKLGVASREEAVARARGLGLI